MNDLVDLLEKNEVLLLSGLKDSIAQVVNENISKCEVVFKGFFSCMCLCPLSSYFRQPLSYEHFLLIL